MMCFLHRWKVSRALDDGVALGDGTTAHLENCTECSLFRDNLARLGGSLSASKDLAVRPSPKTEGRRLLPLVATAAAAAAAVLAIVFISRSPTLETIVISEVHDSPRIDSPRIDSPRIDSPRIVGAEPEAAPLDMSALAGDASGGLRYVLRISGLD